jgi:peptidyl-prolyl cis-trans isomerase SurA
MIVRSGHHGGGIVPTILVSALAASGCASWVPGWMPLVGTKGQPAVEAAAPAEAQVAPASAASPAAANSGAPAEPTERSERPSLDNGVVDRVVAVVNDDVITLTELRENVLYFKVESREPDADDDAIARRLLARLIENRLQLQEADREKISVEDVELTEELGARMKKLNASSEEELEALIKRQGLSMETLKKKLREQLMIAKVVRRKVAFRVSVTEQEVDRYLAENQDKLATGLGYHARHILILPEGDRGDEAWAAARDRAQEAAGRIRNGADFGQVAKEVSKDATAADGGDLGPLKTGELAAEIEAQILKLAPGEVSDPFKSDLGYHVFKLESKETLDGEGMTRLRQQIREILFRQKYQERLEAWLAEIKQRAIIEIRI